MLRKKIQRFGQLIIEFFLPLQCVSCGRDFFVLCRECLSAVALDAQQYKKLTGLDRLFVAARDYHLIDQYIWLLKYQYVSTLAAPLAELLVKRLDKVRWLDNFCLVPVPLHKRRERERGFNQAFLLADQLAGQLNLPVLDCLVRKRYTKPQVNLGREDRLKNVVDVFNLKAASLPLVNQNILLIDDVYTTGATMSECAKVLRQAGAKKVYGLVLAKG